MAYCMLNWVAEVPRSFILSQKFYF